MMELIYTLQLFADAESAYKGIMVHIIQLVILCIPLLLLPTILKTSGSVMGKIAGASDRFHREVTGKAGKGLAKHTPGIRNIPEGYNQWKEARKAGYQRGAAQRAARNSRVIGRVPGVGKYGREALKAQGRNLDNEQVKLAQAALQNDSRYPFDSNSVAEDALKSAAAKGDTVGVRAAVAELATNQAGVGMLHEFIDSQEKKGNMDDDLRDIMRRSINDNWTGLKSKDVALTNWTYETEKIDGKTTPKKIANVRGEAPLSGLTGEQLSSQTYDSLIKASGVSTVDANGNKRETNDVAKDIAASGIINPTMAQSVLESEASKNLTSSTRAVFEAVANSQPQPQPQPQPPGNPNAAPPPPPQNEPRAATGSGNFDQQSEGGVWIPR